MRENSNSKIKHAALAGFFRARHILPRHPRGWGGWVVGNSTLTGPAVVAQPVM